MRYSHAMRLQTHFMQLLMPKALPAGLRRLLHDNAHFACCFLPLLDTTYGCQPHCITPPFSITVAPHTCFDIFFDDEDI